MVIGSGIDIIEVERIQKAIDRWGDHFLRHVFTEEEIKNAEKKKFPAQYYAVRFAAKEAIFKAVGDDPQLTWKDMTILNDEYGRPHCRFRKEKHKFNLTISLSHTHNYAVASAIISS